MTHIPWIAIELFLAVVNPCEWRTPFLTAAEWFCGATTAPLFTPGIGKSTKTPLTARNSTETSLKLLVRPLLYAYQANTKNFNRLFHILAQLTPRFAGWSGSQKQSGLERSSLINVWFTARAHIGVLNIVLVIQRKSRLKSLPCIKS